MNNKDLILPSLIQHITAELEEEDLAAQQRSANWRLRMATLYLAISDEDESLAVYARINITVPLFRIFFEEGDTRPDYRLGRASITALLQLLDQDRRHGWGPTVEVLVFLFWLASGSSYRVVCRAFDMPQSTVHRAIHRVAVALQVVTPLVIKFPNTVEEQREVGEGFGRLAGHQAFQKSMGAIDGCHIRIKAPGEPDAQCYRNRKLFTSIQLQAVCDHRARFIDVFVGFPGSVHDSRILRHSPLYRSGVYPSPGTFLLGDGGYPCLERPITLMTPYKNPVRGAAQRRYNVHHARARCVIERAFGMLKTRWRAIFFQALEVDTTFVPDVIMACTILHNICLGVGDIMAVEGEEPEEEGGDETAIGNEETASGNALRQRIAAQMSTLQNPVGDHDYFSH